MNDFIRNSAKIYIIESPSDNDILEDRFEGKSLSKILEMSEIKNDYYIAINKTILEKVFNLIKKDLTDEYERGNIIMPHIHISAHGNEDGFALSDDYFISWDDFTGYLDIINSAPNVGYSTHAISGIEFSTITLCMSVCNGISGMKMCKDENKSPYAVLIGPTESVLWSDSLLAFSVFYHLTIFKNTFAQDAIAIMNVSSGLDKIFKFNFGNEFEKARDIIITEK